MAQAHQITTSTPRRAAYADAARASGGAPVGFTPCQTRAAYAAANESPDAFELARELGLGARFGGGWR